MRLLGLILLNAVAALAVGEAFNHVVSEWLPCQGERLACTMDGIAGMVVTAVLAILAMIVLGVIAYARPRVRPLDIAVAALALPIAFLLVVTLQEMVLLRDGWDFTWRQWQKLLQIVVPAALVVVLQWLVLRRYLRRSAQPPVTAKG